LQLVRGSASTYLILSLTGTSFYDRSQHVGYSGWSEDVGREGHDGNLGALVEEHVVGIVGTRVQMGLGPIGAVFEVESLKEVVLGAKPTHGSVRRRSWLRVRLVLDVGK
jgi:hypothetical protein